MSIRRMAIFLWRTILIPPSWRRRIWKRLYRRYNNRLADRSVSFLDYGYAPPDTDAELGGLDEAQRTHIHLYHHVGSAVDLRGLDVLEIGCGRGGGATYVAKRLNPRSLVAADLAETAVAYGRSHCREGVRFICCDAQAMPFEDAAFDAVVNIESSHCYPDLAGFLREVRRVLRPGGCLLCADFRRVAKWQSWYDALDETGLQVVQNEDITLAVVRAMELNHERKQNLIRDVAPRYLHRALYEFMGCKGSQVYQDFLAMRSSYVRFVIRKNGLGDGLGHGVHGERVAGP